MIGLNKLREKRMARKAMDRLSIAIEQYDVDAAGRALEALAPSRTIRRSPSMEALA